jgi:hypothetical protein
MYIYVCITIDLGCVGCGEENTRAPSREVPPSLPAPAPPPAQRSVFHCRKTVSLFIAEQPFYLIAEQPLVVGR